MSALKVVNRAVNITTLAVWVISGLWTMFFISWLLLRLVDFGYPVWYQLLDTQDMIHQFSVENRHGRKNFAQTDQAEHARLFSAIVVSVHNKGQGLDDIRYFSPEGKQLGILLTPPEVKHLQDVAAIISFLLDVSFLMMVFFMMTCSYLSYKKTIPPLKKLLCILLLVVVGLSGLVLLLGPERVFYQLHIWFFPQGHQWFFYYQDSLMVILMSGTTLFGVIAISWLAIALLLYACFIFGFYKMMNVLKLKSVNQKMRSPSDE